MTPEQIDRLIDLLIVLGGKAATEGFAIALRRVTFLAVADIAAATLVTLMCCVSLYLAQICWRKHMQEKEGSYHYDNEWGVGCWAIRAAATVIWVTVVPALLISGFDKLINPEWHAVMMLFELL